MHAMRQAEVPQRPPRVLAAMHMRIMPPLAGPAASFDRRVDWLAAEAAGQLAAVQARVPGKDWMHMLCSTCLSPMLTGWQQHADALAEALQARCSLRPLALLKPYQCVGWGYALRFAAQLPGVRHVALTIVDADLHGVLQASYEREIGRVGFGVTTLALALPEHTAVPLCGGPYANRGFTEFMHAIKATQRGRERLPTFLPFLPEGLAGLAERMLGNEGLWPNRHALYGHAFGADPWIGLIEWLRAEPPRAAQAVVLGAFAYNGYIAVGQFEVTPESHVVLRAFGDSALPAAACPERALQ